MNQEKPKISVIVPVYNVENYLSRCVDSLLNQTLRDIEIILVDDGSPDKCPEMCDEYAKMDNRVQVIHKENGGLSSARNEGLKYIKGEYYMFLDSDDWINTETCKVCYEEIIASEADCLMFSYTKEFGNHSIINHVFHHDKIIWDEPDVKAHIHRRLFGLIGQELARPQDSDLIVSACMQLFKASKFKDIRFVDTKIIGTEDCWYQILLYENCEKFVYIDKPFYHYFRANEGSLTTKYNPNLFARWQRMFDYMEDYILKHDKGTDYANALENRIALSVLGAGINQTHSDDSIIDGSRRMKEMLQLKRYGHALSQLDISVMPFAWKVFFLLARNKQTLLLFTMLKLIEYLRTHKR